jgi:hypothetical protein
MSVNRKVTVPVGRLLISSASPRFQRNTIAVEVASDLPCPYLPEYLEGLFREFLLVSAFPYDTGWFCAWSSAFAWVGVLLMYRMAKPVVDFSLHLVFCLQNGTFHKWSRGESNPWPPPCKGGVGSPGASWCAHVRGLNMPISVDRRHTCSGCVRLRSGRVAARLLHRR